MDSQKSSKPAPQRIDPEKLRAVVRGMKKDEVFFLLDRAIDLLSQRGLHALVKGHVNPRGLRPDPDATDDLLSAIRSFDERSRRKEYYEEFDVNSKNCNELSRGSEAWFADFSRLTERCVRAAKARRFAEACEGFRILFSLAQRLEDGSVEMLFFGGVTVSYFEFRTPSNLSPLFVAMLTLKEASTSPTASSSSTSSSWADVSRRAWTQRTRTIAAR